MYNVCAYMYCTCVLKCLCCVGEILLHLYMYMYTIIYMYMYIYMLYICIDVHVHLYMGTPGGVGASSNEVCCDRVFGW